MDESYSEEAINEQLLLVKNLPMGESRGLSLTVRRGTLKAVYSGISNFLFMWGCKPSDGVLAKTEMVSDIINILETNYDR